jgi:hypothetical protein
MLRDFGYHFVFSLTQLLIEYHFTPGPGKVLEIHVVLTPMQHETASWLRADDRARPGYTGRSENSLRRNVVGQGNAACW